MGSNTTPPKLISQKTAIPKYEQKVGGEKILETAKHFRVIFLDGEKWQCKLLQSFAYDLLLEKEDGCIALVPKHSVRHYELNENSVKPEVKHGPQ
jgi:hypothetical protein